MATLVARARPLVAGAYRHSSALCQKGSCLRVAYVRPLVRCMAEQSGPDKSDQDRSDYLSRREDRGGRGSSLARMGGGVGGSPDIRRFGSILSEMQREMDALTRGFFPDFFLSPLMDPLADLRATADLPMRLVTDIEEDDKNYIIKADVPGM